MRGVTHSSHLTENTAEFSYMKSDCPPDCLFFVCFPQRVETLKTAETIDSASSFRRKFEFKTVSLKPILIITVNFEGKKNLTPYNIFKKNELFN